MRIFNFGILFRLPGVKGGVWQMLSIGKFTLKWKAAHKILENLLVFRNVVWFLFYAGQFY